MPRKRHSEERIIYALEQMKEGKGWRVGSWDQRSNSV